MITSPLPSTSPSDQHLLTPQSPVLTTLQTVQAYLLTMARLAVAACCAICLYFLLVCVVSGHSSVLLHGHRQQQSPIDLKDAQAFRYETASETAEAQNAIDAILLKQSAAVQESRYNMEQPGRIKSEKLSRLIKSNTRAGSSAPQSDGPTDRHRYSVIEQDNLAEDLADSYADCSYHLAFTLIEQNSQTNHFTSKLMTKFRNSLASILLHLNATNLDSGALCIHLITDGSVRPYINDVIVRVHEDLVQKSTQATYNQHHRHEHGKTVESDTASSDQHRPMTKYFFIDSLAVESRLEKLLPTLRAYFTHKPNSYYSNALFFYSMVLHQVIPRQVADRLILLDVDVQLDANLLELYEEFGRFKADQVIGIAHEQQPVYRHILHEHRRAHENTTAGSPPPSGFPGYNSGVLLLHLRKMRQSFLYNSLLNEVLITHLARKYRFRGHLGDQDFYTVAALDYPQLFYTLSCGWNRQLCQWWRFHGYGPVFDQYHTCAAPVKLYHGNCNSALPSLTSYGDYRRR